MSAPAKAIMSDPPGSIGRLLERLTELFALFGGLCLLGIMLVQSLSVVGRSLPDLLGVFGLKVPRLTIPGDIEIVQLGCGIAIFFFLPLCQYRRANVMVEFFTQGLPVRFRSAFDAAANVLFLGLVSMITWQLGHGTIEKFTHRDTTMVLRIPESYPLPPRPDRRSTVDRRHRLFLRSRMGRHQPRQSGITSKLQTTRSRLNAR